jgi:DNA-binding CsgD family transcriptional regulator
MQIFQFSPREIDVINLLMKGKSNKHIALELGISRRTVEFHLSNIYTKLLVNSRSEAILALNENRLRESTGSFPVISTVVEEVDSTENGSKSILWRIPLKKLYYFAGSLFVIILITALVFFNPPVRKPVPASATNVPDTPSPASQTQQSPFALPTQLETNQPASIIIPPHTVNGYTAAIESYYLDASHIIFNVRITGGEIAFGDEHFYDRIERPDIFDEYGGLINTSGGWGPALDPVLYHFELVPTIQLKGDRLKGQFSFDLNNAPEYAKILAKFRFDFDLPINPDVRFYPKQTISASGLEMLLDSVTVAPTYTQIYLCFPSPTFADWNIGNQSELQIGDQKANPDNFTLLFDSVIGGDRRAGSEPYWTPSIKTGRCIKNGFPIGSRNPNSLTLSVTQLEKSEPDILVKNQLLLDYPGLSEKQAYYKYLEEHGNIYRGPWIFKINLAQ